MWMRDGVGVVVAAVVGLSSGGALAAPGAHVWSQSFGDGSQQFAEDLAVDGAGNTVLVGQYNGATFNPGTGTLPAASYYYNLYLTKLDSSGTPVWSRAVPGIDDDDFGFVRYERRLAFDSAGNLFIAGNYYGAPDLGCGALPLGAGGTFVAKLDAAGQCVWSRGFPGAHVENPRLAITANGGAVALAGLFRGTLNFGGGAFTSASGQQGLFLARLDSTGGHVWSKHFQTTGGGTFADALGVAFDGSGNLALAGGFSGYLNLGASAMRSRGGQDGFVGRFNGSGGLTWARRFGDAADQVAHGVATDGSGNVVLTGGFGGTLALDTVTLTSGSASDAFLLKLDGTGHAAWGRQFTDAFGTQHGEQVAVDAAGHIATSGRYSGYIDLGAGPLENEGESKRYVAKLDGADTLLWNLAFVNDGAGFDARMAVEPGGDVHVGGQYTGYGYFHGDLFLSQGALDYYDVFVGKYEG